MKKLLLTTALSGLMMSAAFAQSPSSSSPPSASPPAASSSDSIKPDAPKASTSSSMSSEKSTTGASASISSQKPDQFLATKVKGTDVIGSDDKKIGDVSDLLFSKDGKLEAYILSVGGFLGVGAKEVALAPSDVQLIQDKNEWKLKVSMSKDQLAQAPNFERQKEASTTGSGMSSGGSATTPRNAPNPPPASNRP